MPDSNGLLGAAVYQPYPGGDQSPQQYGQPGQPALAAPPPVARAVQLMYIGAAASLIGIVINLTTVSALKSQILKRRPNLTPTQLTTAEHLEIGLLIVAGLIGAALWIWMAQANKRGRSWARITSTVFFAIETISVLTAVSGAGQLAGVGAGRFFGILVWLIGLGAIVLLWQGQSSDYFKVKSAPHY
jgi:hypothetical protein